MAISNITPEEIAARNSIIQSFIKDPELYNNWWESEGKKIADIVIRRKIKRIRFHDMEDLLQDIMIRLWYYLQKGTREFPGKMTTICWWIAKSEADFWLTKSKKKKDFNNLEDDFMNSFRAPDDDIKPTKPSCLTEEEWLFLSMEIEGATLKEIGLVGECSDKAMWDRLSKIKARVKDELLWESRSLEECP